MHTAAYICRKYLWIDLDYKCCPRRCLSPLDFWSKTMREKFLAHTLIVPSTTELLNALTYCVLSPNVYRLCEQRHIVNKRCFGVDNYCEKKFLSLSLVKILDSSSHTPKNPATSLAVIVVPGMTIKFSVLPTPDFVVAQPGVARGGLCCKILVKFVEPPVSPNRYLEFAEVFSLPFSATNHQGGDTTQDLSCW